MKRLFVFAVIFIMMIGVNTAVSFAEGEERFVFTGLTATDKMTGLMWTRDANIAGKDITWKEAFKFIKGLNNKKYAGYSDWRLPTKEELEMLVAYAKSQGYNRNINKLFNKIGFKDVQATYYWSLSTSPYTSGKSLAWFIYMGGGKEVGGAYVATGNKTVDRFVWPVRRGK